MKAEDKIPVLLYHSVYKDPGERKNRYSLSAGEFERHLKLMVSNGILCITAETFLNRDLPGKSGRQECLITFDDGFEDNYLVAFPLLKKYGLTATFFIITGRIGTPGYLNWEQIKEMSGCGMSIQSHTVTHSYLSSLADDALGHELSTSKNDIERRLSTRVDFLSLPYGNFDRTVINSAFSRGYKAVFTSRVEYARVGDALIPRINIEPAFPEKSLAAIINKKKWALGMRKTEQVMKDLVKRVIRYRKTDRHNA